MINPGGPQNGYYKLLNKSKTRAGAVGGSMRSLRQVAAPRPVRPQPLSPASSIAAQRIAAQKQREAQARQNQARANTGVYIKTPTGFNFRNAQGNVAKNVTMKNGQWYRDVQNRMQQYAAPARVAPAKVVQPRRAAIAAGPQVLAAPAPKPFVPPTLPGAGENGDSISAQDLSSENRRHADEVSVLQAEQDKLKSLYDEKGNVVTDPTKGKTLHQWKTEALVKERDENLYESNAALASRGVQFSGSRDQADTDISKNYWEDNGVIEENFGSRRLTKLQQDRDKAIAYHQEQIAAINQGAAERKRANEAAWAAQFQLEQGPLGDDSYGGPMAPEPGQTAAARMAAQKAAEASAVKYKAGFFQKNGVWFYQNPAGQTARATSAPKASWVRVNAGERA